MLPRTQLIRIQRSLYDRLRSQAKGLCGEMNTALKNYYTEYQKDFIRFKGFVTKAQLLDNLQQAAVVLCGDYHTLAQSQKTVVRLLRSLNRPAILALEMLHAEDDAVSQKYLAGTISEAEFQKRIRYKANWGFRWEHYRVLFDHARQHRLKILGLSTREKGGLQSRDQFAARRIVEISKAHPNHLMVGLMGDLHMAEVHLPGKVRALFEKESLRRRVLTIHQNHDPYYWELVSLGMEEFIDVIEMRTDCYCILNTPPWVKLQSHLQWMDVPCELDFTDEFHEISQLILSFLGEKTSKIGNFEAHHFFSRMPLKKFNLDPLSELYVKNFRGFFVPEKNLVFLSDLSLNQLSAQAAIFVHSCLSGFDRVFHNPRQDFYRFILVEALGFLGSKVINLRRKCNGPEDLKRQSEQGPHSGVAQAVLQHLAWEGNALSRHLKSGRLPFLSDTPDARKVLFSYRVARVLGQLLGNAIYRGLIEHRVQQEEVRRLFRSNFSSPQKCRADYLDWAQRLDREGFRELSSTDRF